MIIATVTMGTTTLALPLLLPSLSDPMVGTPTTPSTTVVVVVVVVVVGARHVLLDLLISGTPTVLK